MTGQDWGSEGGWPLTRLEQKGPVHIMGHAKEAGVLGSKALKVFAQGLVVHACVRACILPPPAKNLRRAAASEPGWAAALVKSLTSWVRVRFLWSGGVSEVRYLLLVAFALSDEGAANPEKGYVMDELHLFLFFCFFICCAFEYLSKVRSSSACHAKNTTEKCYHVVNALCRLPPVNLICTFALSVTHFKCKASSVPLTFGKKWDSFTSHRLCSFVWLFLINYIRGKVMWSH